jgi:murein DD-endopeptidase MepM/ murein hydrolase activator NlpD
MANKHYTVMIVPERSSQVRRFIVQKRWVGYALLGIAGAFSIASFFFIHYLYIVQEVAANRRLKEDNIQLRAQLKLVRDRVDTVSDTLERIERFSVKLKAITQLSDPERSLAMGPLQSGERIDDGPSAKHEVKLAVGESDRDDEPINSELSAALLTARLDDQLSDARKKEDDLRELQEYYESQKIFLATTPSIWPSRGWVTSKFGVRSDPYTERQAMHKGLDIAGPVGTSVLAPSDGFVIFASSRSGYGNTVVLDHGFGVQTHFGHMQDNLPVKVGEHITRGHVLGYMGNTGRSTGPHLHYEVRIHGIPQNPQKFILD